MAFNPSSETEKRVAVYPKILRFTQLDIAPSFSNPAHPNVEEAISLIRGRQLDPAVFGDLTVHRDKQGVVWCENNRRLYVLRKAGVPSVSVKFISNDYISRRIKGDDKKRLNDPAFLPRIRGETSGVQTPAPSISGANFDQELKWTSGVQTPPPSISWASFGQELTRTSGVQIPPPPSSVLTSVDQEQKGTSMLGFLGTVSAAVAAGYWGWKVYNSQQENDQDGDDDRNKKY